MEMANIGFQMKRKELTKTFMIISNTKETFFFMVYTEIFQRCKGQAIVLDTA